MDTARPRALAVMRPHESVDLGADLGEVACLVTAGGGVGVAVHRVARPHHRMAGVAHRPQQRRQRRLDLARAHTRDECESAGDARRVQPLAQFEHVVGGCARPDLAADRVADAAQELDVRAVEVACAFTDPQHVRRAVVPTAGQGVLPRERFFVAEQQRLVARVDVDLAEVVVVLDLDPAGAHELEGTVDVVGELLVAPSLGARRHELLGPRVHPGEIGETALGERPYQVQCGRRLVVRLDESVGVGHARGLSGRGVVDDVAAEARQADVTHQLEVARTWLGELAGHPTDLHHRHAQAVGEHDRHLQDDAQLLADVDRGELLEALGTVAGLQQERVAGGHLGERRLQRPGLAGEHEWGIGRDLLQRSVEVALVRPGRLLLRRERLPRRRCPGASHASDASDGPPTDGRENRPARGRVPARRWAASVRGARRS